MQPLRVAVIGAGRVGTALATALARLPDVEVAGVSSRTPAHAEALAARLGVVHLSPAEALTADLTLVAVADDAIAPVVAALAADLGESDGEGRCVVHCSGALGLEPLQPLAARGWQVGSWHPAQSFAPQAAGVAPDVAFTITAAEPWSSRLAGLTDAFGARPVRLAAEQRPAYHAALVLATNLGQTLMARAVDVLVGTGMTRDQALAVLLPLLRGGLDNVEQVGLPAAITGPLVRGDLGTVRGHLGGLAPYPEAERLYREVSTSLVPLLVERGLAVPVGEQALAILGTEQAEQPPDPKGSPS